jgi:hypothetical protein
MIHGDVSYIDGMGESGLERLCDKWFELSDDLESVGRPWFRVYRVPLAANEEDQRRFVGEYTAPPTWDQIRADHGIGRYEVILVGSPPKPKATTIQRLIRTMSYQVFPWLDASRLTIPLGRASAAMFDTIKFEDMKPPMPKPIATQEQPSLFNPDDVALPKYAAGSDTSFMAAEAIAPMVTKLQNMVLGVMLAKGTDGATCDEVEVALEMPHQTASARINELKEDDVEAGRPQMLFDSGNRRKTRHGQLATVWIHRTVLFG